VWWIGSLVFWEDEKVKVFTQNHFKNNKIIASICASPRNLLRWWIVSGKKLTGNDWDNNFWTLAEKSWAIYKKEEIVIDGNLITAYGPENVEEFSLAIIKALS
jgi:putative intracellular protease/amidase